MILGMGLLYLGHGQILWKDTGGGVKGAGVWELERVK